MGSPGPPLPRGPSGRSGRSADRLGDNDPSGGADRQPGRICPYRFVSFQILDPLREPDQALVYSYFDGVDSTMDEILTALDRGIELMKERREQDV